MRRRQYYRCIVCACFLFYMNYFFGITDYLCSRNFENDFDYPLNIDIRPIVDDVLSGKKPTIAPINYYPHRFLTNSGICTTLEKLDLFIVVKSALGNFGRRSAIRDTYGQDNIIPGRIIKTLFFLGVDDPRNSVTQSMIDKEMALYKDVIQIDFHDTYYNNTIKTMMSFRWLYENCPIADFYLFTDDDMYISVKNLLEYVQDKTKGNAANYRGMGVHFFSGYVFNSAPQRFRSSKWRVTLDEYPWNRWPPYVTAGAYVVSNKTMKSLYIGSLFVKHFRFDDIYLSIVAKKVGVQPTHCERFHFYKKQYTKEDYRYVIASHGYGDRSELTSVWLEQNSIT